MLVYQRVIISCSLGVQMIKDYIVHFSIETIMVT